MSGERIMFRGSRILLPAAIALSPMSLFAQSSDAVAPEATKSRNIETVVVTAQKREELLQDVPASISVLGGEQVENLSLNSLSDFATYVPGFAGGHVHQRCAGRLIQEPLFVHS